MRFSFKTPAVSKFRLRLRQGVVFQCYMVLCLFALMTALALFNADGYLQDGLVLFAFLALCSEFIAFGAFIAAEIAFRKPGQLAKAKGTFVLLVGLGLAGFNVYNGDRANTSSEQRRQIAYEARVDAAVAEATNVARGSKEAAEARIRAVPPPDLSGGPQNDRTAQAAWDKVTEIDRANVAQAGLDITAAANRARQAAGKAPEPMPKAWLHAGLLFLEVVKVGGLWSLGLDFGAKHVPTPGRVPTWSQLALAKRKDRSAYRQKLREEFGAEVVDQMLAA